MSMRFRGGGVGHLDKQLSLSIEAYDEPVHLSRDDDDDVTMEDVTTTTGGEAITRRECISPAPNVDSALTRLT